MDTQEIMQLALKIAALEKIPEDSAIYVNGNNIRKVLMGIGAGVPPAERLKAEQKGTAL